MQATVQDAGPLRKQLTLTFTTTEISERRDQILGRLAGRAKLPGFRAGKAPKGVLMKRYGQGAQTEAEQALIDEGLRQALREHQLQPLGPLHFEKPVRSDGVSVSVNFDVRPPIALPEPNTIQLPQADISAGEEEIAEELQQIARRFGSERELADTDALVADDMLVLSGAVHSGDELVRQVHDLHHMVGAYPLFGLEPAAVVELFAGKHVGDGVDFEATLPDNFTPEQWAGKTARVELSIQQGRRQEPAELDEALAGRLGTENVEGLRTRVTEMIVSRKRSDLERQQTEALVDGLIAATAFELPEKVVTDAITHQLDQLVQARKLSGTEADEFRASQKAEVSGQIERQLRQHLLMDAIADRYAVRASQQDLQQQIMMAAYRSGRRPEDVAKDLQESGRINEVASEIRQYKALELFRRKALGEDDAEAAAPGQEGQSAEAEA